MDLVEAFNFDGRRDAILMAHYIACGDETSSNLAHQVGFGPDALVDCVGAE